MEHAKLIYLCLLVVLVLFIIGFLTTYVFTSTWMLGGMIPLPRILNGD